MTDNKPTGAGAGALCTPFHCWSLKHHSMDCPARQPAAVGLPEMEADTEDGAFGTAAYCHHRHHLEEHSTNFSTCPHSVCKSARQAAVHTFVEKYPGLGVWSEGRCHRPGCGRLRAEHPPSHPYPLSPTAPPATPAAEGEASADPALDLAQALVGEDVRHMVKIIRETFASRDREVAGLEDELDRRAGLLQKQQRQQCAELGCDEPAPPYCERHRGDWIGRNKIVLELQARASRAEQERDAARAKLEGMRPPLDPDESKNDRYWLGWNDCITSALQP